MIKYGTGSNELYYPTITTEGITIYNTEPACANGNGCDVHAYLMDNYVATDPMIELIDETNIYNVYTSEIFSVQYSEGCCGTYVGDNVGTACADVYFLYLNDPTVSPTYGPTRDPTTAPTTTRPSTYPYLKCTPLMIIFSNCFEFPIKNMITTSQHLFRAYHQV